VFYGDAANLELLRAAGADKARLLVIAIDDREKVLDMIHIAQMHFPRLKVLVRAYDRTHAYELIRAGADIIIRETFGSAMLMGKEALEALGHSEKRAKRMADSFAEHDRQGMFRLSEVWGDDHEYGLRIRQNLLDLETVLREEKEEPED
jgi:glutathione-regulated potassium-efflux system ancillary protein KefC/glutathione-regulated potassium-efflux system protein KefB